MIKVKQSYYYCGEEIKIIDYNWIVHITNITIINNNQKYLQTSFSISNTYVILVKYISVIL